MAYADTLDVLARLVPRLDEATIDSMGVVIDPLTNAPYSGIPQVLRDFNVARAKRYERTGKLLRVPELTGGPVGEVRAYFRAMLHGDGSPSFEYDVSQRRVVKHDSKRNHRTTDL